MGWIYHASSAIEEKSKYPTIVAVCIVLPLLSALVVGTRIGLHAKAAHIAVDDYFAGLSMIFGIIYGATSITQTRYGLGLPLALRPKANLTSYTRVNFAGRPFYQLGILGFKVALCLSYLRLLKGTTHRQLYKYIIWTAMILISAGHIAGCLVLIFNCKPVSRSWTPLGPGTCLPFGPVNYGLAGITIGSDILVAFLPIPLLLALNIRLSQKMALVGLFILGLFTTVCSIFRTLEINTIAHGDGDSTMLVCWGVVELNVGNIVTSAPFLAPLLWRRIKHYRSKYSSGYGNGNREYQKYGSSQGSKNRSKNHILSKSGDYAVELQGVERKSRNGGHVRDDETALTRTRSEDRILGSGSSFGDVGDQTIVKTVAYHVSVDDASLYQAEEESRSAKSDQKKEGHSGL